jgi:hypothetical protein
MQFRCNLAAAGWLSGLGLGEQAGRQDQQVSGSVGKFTKVPEFRIGACRHGVFQLGKQAGIYILAANLNVCLPLVSLSGLGTEAPEVLFRCGL